MEQVIFNEECAREGVPRTAGGMGVQMIGPTIIAHGTDEQKKRYLPKMLSGEEVWCQGFSEPNAGSDLGNLQSKAVEDGDDYLITGQKIWTSGAQTASWCFFLARTDTEVRKHKGISYFLVDMKTPGIEVRPIKQITGDSHFNEMFFEKVRAPKENMLGGLNKGWYVAMSTLAHERSGIGNAIQFRKSVDRVLDLARKIKKNGVPISKDASVRNRLVQLVFDVHAQTYTGFRNLAKQLTDAVPGPEAYVSKVFTGEFLQRLSAMAMELQGPYAQLWVGSPEIIDNGVWQGEWVGNRSITIAGGSSEVNRNLIGTPELENRGPDGQGGQRSRIIPIRLPRDS